MSAAKHRRPVEVATCQRYGKRKIQEPRRTMYRVLRERESYVDVMDIPGTVARGCDVDVSRGDDTCGVLPGSQVVLPCCGEDVEVVPPYSVHTNRHIPRVVPTSKPHPARLIALLASKAVHPPRCQRANPEMRIKYLLKYECSLSFRCILSGTSVKNDAAQLRRFIN